MTKISEDLTNIEEALEELLLEYTTAGVRGALEHDFNRAGQVVTNKIAGGLTKLGHKLRAGEYKSKFETSAKNYNKANADYKTAKASGDAAAMVAAQNNMRYHSGQMNTHMNNLRSAGISARIKPKAPQQPTQQQPSTTQSQAQTNGNQANSNVTPGAQRSAQVAATRKSGKPGAVRNLANKFAEEDRRAAGTASEAYSIAEELIVSLLEGMENRNKGAIIKKTEIIKDGKPHVKGTFVETEIIKKPTTFKRKEICKRASEKAEGALSAIKREVANELKEVAGQE